MKKFIKTHKIKLKKDIISKTKVWGHAIVVCMEYGFLSKKEIESARVLIKRKIGKEGKIFFTLDPSKAITRKGAHSRMGKGKGKIKEYCFPVKKGTIIFKIFERGDSVWKLFSLSIIKFSINVKIFGRDNDLKDTIINNIIK